MRSRRAGTLLATLLLVVTLGPATIACRSTPESAGTLYQRLGAEKGMDALMDVFLDRVAADARISPYFVDSDMGRLRTQFAAMLAQATGGPQRYDGPDVATIHKDMKITGTEFDAFVEDLRAALREREVRSREAGELIGLVEAMKGDVVHR